MKKTLRDDIISQLLMNKDVIIPVSLKHCHVYGLHSLVLENKDSGLLRRLFVADFHHEMWKNRLTDSGFRYLMSVAVHTHHSSLTLSGVKGNWINYHFARASELYSHKIELGSFVYESAITGENKKATFQFKGTKYLSRVRETDVSPGEVVRLSSRDLHTVFVPYQTEAAWMVDELEEDPLYDTLCYSNDLDLDKFDGCGLYEPMTEESFDKILDWLKK